MDAHFWEQRHKRIHSIHLGAQHCWNPMIDIYTSNTYTHVFIQPWLILISIQLFPHYVAFKAQCCDWRQIGFAALPLGIKYDISYWIKNESIQAHCPQRHRWSDCLIQCSCFTKGTHMGALTDLHHKTLGKNVSVRCVQANSCECTETDWHTHTHFTGSWICMPERPQHRGDNKSHFRHVCQVSRLHLSPGWMWVVGSE